MISANDDTYCGHCKEWTFGQRCNWCSRATTLYSPEQEVVRYGSYRRFRAAGLDHRLACAAVDAETHLLAVTHRANAHAVRELLDEGRRESERPPDARLLSAPMAVAVAA